jgi:hypothetical protein
VDFDPGYDASIDNHNKTIWFHNLGHHYIHFITIKAQNPMLIHNVFQPGRVVTILPSSDPEVSNFKLFLFAYS